MVFCEPGGQPGALLRAQRPAPSIFLHAAGREGKHHDHNIAASSCCKLSSTIPQHHQRLNPYHLTSSSAKRPGSSSARILMSVYSCGPTPSPLARSWSAHGCPSLGEYTAYRLSFTTLPWHAARAGVCVSNLGVWIRGLDLGLHTRWKDLQCTLAYFRPYLPSEQGQRVGA